MDLQQDLWRIVTAAASFALSPSVSCFRRAYSLVAVEFHRVFRRHSGNDLDLQRISLLWDRGRLPDSRALNADVTPDLFRKCKGKTA